MPQVNIERLIITWGELWEHIGYFFVNTTFPVLRIYNKLKIQLLFGAGASYFAIYANCVFTPCNCCQLPYLTFPPTPQASPFHANKIGDLRCKSTMIE